MSGRVGGDRGRGRRGGRGGGGRGEPSQPRAPAPAPSYGRGRGLESTQSTRGRGGASYARQPQPQPQHQPPAPQPQPRAPQPQPQHQPHAPQPQPQSQHQPHAPQPQPRAPQPGEPSTLVQRLTISTAQQVPHPSPPPRSSKSNGFPPRPGFGRSGRKCIVRANHFLVDLAHNCDICHYDVAISPETSSRNLNRSIIAELVKLHKSSYLGGRTLVYDGRKSMYTAGQLPFPSKEFVIKLEQTDRISNREREFRVTIKFATETNLHHLGQFLEMRQLDSPQATIQALDVVLRESPCTKYTTIGRSFFSTQFSYGENANLGGGAEYWRGFFQSLRPTQMGLSLNIDIAATSFYKGASLVNFVTEYLNLQDTTRPLSSHDKIKLKKVLKGVRVETTHNPKLPIRYKITGISSVPMEDITFAVEDNGASLSIIQYFREKYGYNLRFVKWPCLLAGNDSRPKYIPVEVCLIIPGQRYVKKLSENQVRSMLKATCKRPRERENNILQVVNENNYSDDKYAKEFGLKIYNKMVSVEARVLPPPVLKYHESGEEKSCQPSVGQWNMMRMKMVNGGSVTNWACLNFSQRSRRDVVTNFCDALVAMCNHKGMVFNRRPCIDHIAADPRNLEFALRDLHKRASRQVPNGQLDLLIIILPDLSGSYGMIKKVCETELGIVSQCCSPRHVAGCNNQYLENISLKINVKVGGRNNVLEDALSKSKVIPYLTDRPTIIFGADVTHPAPGEDSSPSIAAVVASMDWPEVTKYRGVVSAQTHREEIIKNLYSVVEDPRKGKSHSGMIRELLIAFYKSTNRKPERIIFYRDGVSEGQFSEVLLDEVDQIRRACASLQEGYLPPVTFVVVQKRHHTRLFPEVHGDRRSTDRSGNILPGTVVDTKICHPTEFDFYLCSHAGIQGTSRPTHYHVLYDENNFTADGLQTLTNNLCYTYARCTRSVSIVPPAYYAHLAAFRARYYMEAEQTDTSTSLGDRSRENPVSLEMLPEIKENVKDVMFYC